MSDITDEMVLRAAFGMCIHGCYPHPNRSSPSYHPPCSRCMSNARKALTAARAVDPLVAERDVFRDSAAELLAEVTRHHADFEKWEDMADRAVKRSERYRATLEWVQLHDHSHDAQLARVVAEGLRGEGG